MKPLVSVIIPTYNNEKTLGRALDSIENQTHANLEIIVVDDNSTDGTRNVAQQHAARDSRIRILTAPEDPQRYDARLQRNVNAGWSARNCGLAEARGAYLTFQDGDDLSFLTRIETQLALLSKTRATFITTDWLPVTSKTLSRAHSRTIPGLLPPALGPKDILALSQKAKGIIPKLLPDLNSVISFYYKRLPLLHHLFFGSLDSYPGAGNSCFFTREVFPRVRFRPLAERVWPSFMGRGADRDFNFQVAETFKNSYYFPIPLYLWDK